LAADAAAAVAVELITKTIGAVDEAARLRGDELVRKSQGAVERFVESLSRCRLLFVAFPNENRFPHLPELLSAAPTKPAASGFRRWE